VLILFFSFKLNFGLVSFRLPLFSLPFLFLFLDSLRWWYISCPTLTFLSSNEEEEEEKNESECSFVRSFVRLFVCSFFFVLDTLDVCAAAAAAGFRVLSLSFERQSWFSALSFLILCCCCWFSRQQPNDQNGFNLLECLTYFSYEGQPVKVKETPITCP